MVNPRLIAAVRQALGPGGWTRDRTYRNSHLMVWNHRDGLLTTVLDPGWSGYPWATIRILQVVNGDQHVTANCLVGSWQQAVDILAAYGILPDHATSGYMRSLADQTAWSAAWLTG